MSDAVLAREDVSPAGKLILMALQRFGREGNRCFPSNDKIAGAIGVSVATVKRTLPELAELGLIVLVTDDPKTPKGRRIDKVWMDDPTLHPRFADTPRLEGQFAPRP